MQFVYPMFLLALLAIAIPILIHLFHFRRFKKVYFTNVKFLREVKEETASRSRLKNLLVLLARILAIAFLVFAFAQPFIPQKNEAGKFGRKAVSLYVDNSFSMDARTSDVPLLEKAKQRAREIVQAYATDDEFQILTTDFEGRHQRLVSQEDALALIDEIRTTFAVQPLSKVFAKQAQTLQTAKAGNKITYLISDFQKNVTDLEPVEDTTIAINLVALQSVQLRNISLDSCWFEAPVQMLHQTNRLIIKATNWGDEVAEDLPLTLRLDGQVKPIGNLTLPAQETVYDTVNLTIVRTGWHEAELSITDYPVNFDDTYHFAFDVKKEIKVLAINESMPNPFLSSVFGTTGYFVVDNQSNTKLDYSKLPDYQLIILNELVNISTGLAAEVKQYLQRGGNILVFPAPNANLASYNNFLNNLNANDLSGFEEKPREVTFINTDEFIFQDVYINKNANLKLPATTGNQKINRRGNRGEEVLLRYRDGGTYLGKYPVEGGNLYLCAAPLQTKYNNLVEYAEVFVPMLYKMAVSTGRDTRIAYVIGQDETLESDNRLQKDEIIYKMKGNSEEFIPGQRNIGSKVIISVGGQINQAGFYNLFLQENEPITKFAFNYDRRESNLAYYSEEELQTKVGSLVEVISTNTNADFKMILDERSKGVTLWKWCLLFALLFLLAESLLLRFWKD